MFKTAAIALLAIVLNFMPAHASPETHAQAVRDLLKAMDFEKMLDVSIKSSAEAYADRTAQPAKARPRIEKILRETMGANVVEDDVVRIYQKYFSESEVQDLLKFYSSPTGRKMAASQIKLMHELSTVGEARLQARQGEIQKIMNEYKKK